MNFNDAIKEIIPTINDETCTKVVAKLEEMGVESMDELPLVKEQDLVEVLPIIKIRKLLQGWKLLGKEPSTSNAPVIPKQPSTSNTATDLNWADTFELPVDLLSPDLRKILLDGKRPDPKGRRELVKITVNEMVKFCPKPLKRHTDTVARRLVTRFPSLIDKNLEDGAILGRGFESLSVQLKYRAENVNRTPVSVSRVYSGQEDVEEPPRKKMKSSYGCVNHNPKDIPDGESIESLSLMQTDLTTKFREGERAWEMDAIDHLMELTFFLQRRDINKCQTVLELQPTWPFLFQESGMLIHFRKLLAVELDPAGIDSTVMKLLAYLKKQNVSRYPVHLRNAATRVLQEFDTIEDENRDVRLCASILLLMSFFKEDSQSLFIEADETCTAADVHSMANIPATPCLIFCGQSCLLADRYFLSIDKCVVNDNIKTFYNGFCMLFASFFIFNIQYPQTASGTLDMVQRCIFRINPDRGSKVDKKGKKKVYSATNPKVLTLLNNIRDQDWFGE